MSKLKINLMELAAAFEDHSDLISYYLDKETGEIIPVNMETDSDLESIYDTYRDPESGVVDWETAFQEEDVQDWHQEELREADRVVQGLGTRLVKVPTLPSHEGFEDMEGFVESVRDMRLQQRLMIALRDKHPFRNFKMALNYYPEERERWFEYKNERMEERARGWLEMEGIELEEGE